MQVRRKSRSAAGIAAAQAAAGGYGSDEEVASSRGQCAALFASMYPQGASTDAWHSLALQKLLQVLALSLRAQVYQTAHAVDAAAKAQAPEYDSDDNLVVPDKFNKAIEPLKPLDHDQIEYEDFNKDFYEPAAEIAALTEGQVGVSMLLEGVAHLLLKC
jgi:hypothetical protein